MVMNRVARLAARRQLRPPAEKGFQKVGIVGTRPALPETEDVNGSQHERQRADAEAEPRRVRLLPKKIGETPTLKSSSARVKRMLIPPMPHNLPSLPSPAWVLMTGLPILRS